MDYSMFCIYIHDENKWQFVTYEKFTNYEGTKAFVSKYKIVYIYSDMNLIVKCLNYETFQEDYLKLPRWDREEKFQEQMELLLKFKASKI
jgi:hypothetical protein